MNKDPLIERLCASNLVSPDIARSIAAKFMPMTLSKNEFLLKAGRISDRYFFLENGFLRAFAIDTEGNEVTTQFFAPGAFAFEVASFFNRTPSKENIQALADCEGRCLSYAQLNNLFHELPQFREFGRSVLVRGYAALKDRMLTQITATAEERYAHLLQTNPEVLQQAPLKHIASYLGITDTSLSRIRKEVAQGT